MQWIPALACRTVGRCVNAVDTSPGRSSLSKKYRDCAGGCLRRVIVSGSSNWSISERGFHTQSYAVRHYASSEQHSYCPKPSLIQDYTVALLAPQLNEEKPRLSVGNRSAIANRTADPGPTGHMNSVVGYDYSQLACGCFYILRDEPHTR
jgi:hypothetical protein